MVDRGARFAAGRLQPDRAGAAPAVLSERTGRDWKHHRCDVVPAAQWDLGWRERSARQAGFGLAVATALRKQETRVELHWLCSKGGIEEGLVAAAGIPFTPIHAGKLNRFASLQTLRDHPPIYEYFLQRYSAEPAAR